MDKWTGFTLRQYASAAIAESWGTLAVEVTKERWPRAA